MSTVEITATTPKMQKALDEVVKEMVSCEDCKSLIHPDDDPDCFVEVGNMRRLHKGIVLCERCRGQHESELDQERSP